MPDIKISNQEETKKGWVFEVLVDDMEFSVFLDRDYWQELTGGGEDEGSLICRAFEFLLEREPKDSILQSFNLSDIETYFPEFKEEITL